jgi:hypothetical protein
MEKINILSFNVKNIKTNNYLFVISLICIKILNTNKRYSIKLAKFIEENKMTCMDYKFPNTAYTYKNGNFENRIDHVITKLQGYCNRL